MWASAAVAHLLQEMTCCVFRHAVLHTLVLRSFYFNDLYNQQPSELLLAGYFFGPNSRDGCRGSAFLEPITKARSKSVKTSSFPNLMLSLDFTRSS